MRLKDRERFAILLQNKFNDEKTVYDTVRKISLRQHRHFNEAIVDGKRTYIIYDIDKKYLFNMATNKKLKIIWKDAEDFYIIDFSNNTKGDIISHLTFDETNGDKIEGAIMYEKVKPEVAGAGKIITGITLKNKNGISIHFPTLDSAEPYIYEDFCFYEKI